MNVRSKLIFLAVVLAIFSLVGTAAAQEVEPFSAEGIPPGSDYVYRQHYAQVQEIMEISDVSERAQTLEAFYNKLPPEAQMHQHMEAYFGQILQAYREAGMDSQAKALSDKMGEWFPNSESMMPQRFQEAFEAKNYARAIELGEQLLQKNPGDAQILVMLAQSYLATDQTGKMAQTAPRVVEALGPQKAIFYVVWLANHFRGQGDMERAVNYYNVALQAYPSGTPEIYEEAQWRDIKIAAYGTRASLANRQENFQGMIEALENVVELDPRNDGAYLSIGLSHWKLQELEAAEMAFAKAVVLDGSNSAKARQYLEQLYKPRNNDSLEGLDKLLDKARAELNL